MNWLDFFAAIIGSLAWPVACIVLVYLLRKPLTELLIALTRLKNLEFKDLKLSFRDELRELKEKVVDSTSAEAIEEENSVSGADLGVHPKIEEAKRLASDFPEPAVAVGWQAVEETLYNAVERLGLQSGQRMFSPSRSIQLLSSEGYLHRENVEILQRMRTLRNAAVHGSSGYIDISTNDANEFIALASAIIKTLNEINRD